MNKLQQIQYSVTFILVCLIWINGYGQKQTKVYKEIYTVGQDAVLDINVSHADIEFETWDKNKVEITAEITVEGISKKKADDYFRRNKINIKGNSTEIQISSTAGSILEFEYSRLLHDHVKESMSNIIETQKYFDIRKFDADLDSLSPKLELLELEIDSLSHIFGNTVQLNKLSKNQAFLFPDIQLEFDYEAYKKDGDTYLKKWKKELDKSIYNTQNENRQIVIAGKKENFLADRKKLNKIRKKAYDKRRKALLEEREAKSKALLKKRAAKKAAYFAKRNALKAKRNAHKYEITSRDFAYSPDSIYFTDPNIYYLSEDGEDKDIKIKKTIKIKMPKSVTLKMNVRHGEVKLAQHTKNIQANLSYTSLYAATIDGDKTVIEAAYSPVSVQNWNYGQLKADFSDDIDLKEVQHLTLSSNSSNVTIDRLLKSAWIQNDFGPLQINYISKNFTDVDISMKNAELVSAVPSVPFTIYVNGTHSKLAYPKNLQLSKTTNQNRTIYKGYHINKNSEKSIIINSSYSDVVIKE